MKLFLKRLSLGIYILLLIVVTGKLFFEQEFNATIAILWPQKENSTQLLTIGISAPIVSKIPTANDVGSRMYLLQTFEPLVRRTPSLELESSLALSYGMLSPTEWEFRLRPNVQFHDGSLLTPQDVKIALEISQRGTGVSDMLSTVTDISIKGHSLHITTNEPDVLLPQKMASVLIFKQVGDSYLGTGPYRPTDTGFEHFSSYWGVAPAYENVTLVPLLTKQEKVAALGSASVDILMNIPADVADEFTHEKYSLAVQPGIEADMLLMNTKGPLAEPALRKAIQKIVDPSTLARFGHGFATVTNQLIPPAVFGYNPTISLVVGDPESAQKILLESKTTLPDTLEIDLPSGLETFGKTVATQFKPLTIPLTVNTLSAQDLSTKIVQASSPFYFFGWQHDLGDSLPFLASVLHSRTGSFGEFNGINYVNPQVDSLIEQALRTSDQSVRRELQRQIMKIVVVDDAVAVPLFAPDSLYAVKKGIIFSPRVDGYVLASDFVVK